MYLLNQHTSTEYVEYIQQSALLIKQWLEQAQLYQGGSSAQVCQAGTLNISVQGESMDAILAKIETDFLPNSICTANTHCLAHLHPPSLLIGQVAELFISATNQSMDSWNQSPIATHMETELIQWLCQQCQFNTKNTKTQAGGVFTSGGTQSNLMGILLARNHYYLKQGINIQRDGLSHVNAGKILCSDQAHFSIEKNAGVLGLGTSSVVKVDSDAQGRLLIANLKQHIAQIGANNILAIVATAGTTDSGAIDPLPEMAMLCRQHDIWLHIDGAWGGALLLSQKYRHLIQGFEQANSISLDFHKHFFLPISCGAFLLPERSHFESIRHHSNYLNSQDDETDNIPNLVTYSLQTTRRFDALKLWLALSHLGTHTYAKLIDTCIDTAKQVAEYICQNHDIADEITLVTQVNLSSVLFYFNPQHHQLTAEQIAKLNREIAQYLLTANIANVASTQFKQQFCLKLTILNPDTQLADIQDIIQQVIDTGHALLQQGT
ncbi:pyridoxal phosphate-dependent decarboxylase family protein [Psychrobacter sp. I-STPA6b]|uniref:pyridoxal phosphate-dependent decarboxylase family protein n=1 Tax=Psychrobacter sp. I-STPA6b TaxID=2585718 RepID=UPI001D0CA997|nr:pyridoxal-dependent decarboxylase [Psychrobacter sp. I-STPA6b]